MFSFYIFKINVHIPVRQSVRARTPIPEGEEGGPNEIKVEADIENKG